jgi:hypothetical protein
MQEILVDTYEDSNQIVNVDGGTGKIISATSDGPGAPGGSGLGELLLLQMTCPTPYALAALWWTLLLCWVLLFPFCFLCELCMVPDAPLPASPAVVDKWGYLWSGGGTYIKDFGGATGRKHMVIRFNTEDPSMGFQYFPSTMRPT